MNTTSRNTWEYKPPAAKDIPQDFRVTLLPNARNPHGVLSSKVMCFCPIPNQSYVLSCVGKNDSLLMQATGEPALLMGISVLFSIWDALNSSRFGFADFAV